MIDLKKKKDLVRKDAFLRRKTAHSQYAADDSDVSAALLSSVLTKYYGTPLAGYMPIRTEINPVPALEKAAIHGLVGLPVIQGVNLPLRFSQWKPDSAMINGLFGAKIPYLDNFFEPEIIIVPLVAFDKYGGRSSKTSNAPAKGWRSNDTASGTI